MLLSLGMGLDILPRGCQSWLLGLLWRTSSNWQFEWLWDLAIQPVVKEPEEEKNPFQVGHPSQGLNELAAAPVVEGAG